MAKTLVSVWMVAVVGLGNLCWVDRKAIIKRMAYEIGCRVGGGG